MKKRSRARGVTASGRSATPSRYVQLTHFMLNSEAWQSLRPVARALFVELNQRFSGFNNGNIGFGWREAAKALHVKPETVGKAFKELQNRGFIKMTRKSGFDQKRLACEWRLTTLPMGDARAPTSPPTNDYVHWKSELKKQKPDPKGSMHRAERECRNRISLTGEQVQHPQSALPESVWPSHRSEKGYTSSYHARAGVLS